MEEQLVSQSIICLRYKLNRMDLVLDSDSLSFGMGSCATHAWYKKLKLSMILCMHRSYLFEERAEFHAVTTWPFRLQQSIGVKAFSVYVSAGFFLYSDQPNYIRQSGGLLREPRMS